MGATPFLPPVFDAHVDSLQRAVDLEHDLGTHTAGHLDLVRGREGGLSSVVLVSWVDPAYLATGPGSARRRTDDLLDAYHALVENHPGQVRAVVDGAGLDSAREDGVIAAIAGIEGGHSIEESLEYLEHYHRRGVRMMTLVWNNHLSWVRSCQAGAGPDIPEGLSPFGREVVRRMNELGMVVDVSHASERAFYDALEVSTQPIVASHSGCAAIHSHVRNLSDAQLSDLASAGGVVGIVFCTSFLDGDAGALEREERESEAYRALSHDNETGLFHLQADHLQATLPPLCMDRVVDHVLHAVEVCGIRHVGVGSDFDGIQRRPEGLEDASCYGHLAQALLRRGLNEDDVCAVMGGNMARVFRAVTA
ncbi:MAG TPA: membrane dipeptidase [Planctomycetes bacterium]|nr:membrane dipeptidase [Planctomycetota bacterium]HIK61845.1 membrane dipeptidase [Planctomycetota bacterium]